MTINQGVIGLSTLALAGFASIPATGAQDQKINLLCSGTYRYFPKEAEASERDAVITIDLAKKFVAVENAILDGHYKITSLTDAIIEVERDGSFNSVQLIGRINRFTGEVFFHDALPPGGGRLTYSVSWTCKPASRLF